MEDNYDQLVKKSSTWRDPFYASLRISSAWITIGAVLALLGGTFLPHGFFQKDAPHQPIQTLPPSKTPPVQQESSWNIFSNSALGISFQYPPQWYMHQIKSSSGETIIYATAPVSNPNPNTKIKNQQLTFQVRQQNNGDNETLQAWAAKEVAKHAGQTIQQSLTIDGEPALQLQFSDTASSLTAVNIGEYRYLIAANVFTEQYKDYNALFTYVISTIHIKP